MAVSSKPFEGTISNLVVPGTAVGPTLAVPDNTHTILIYNPGAGTVYAQWVDVAGSFSIALAVVVPAGGAVSLAVGPKSGRPQGGVGAVANTLFFDATVATSIKVTYVNGITT